MSKFFIFSLLVALVFLFTQCEKEEVLFSSEVYKNHQDSVKYVGMQTCRSCHSNIHSDYIQTGMGRSFDKASFEKSDAIYDEHAVVFDENSNFYYQPFFKDSSLYIREYRLENKDTVHSRTEKISYIVGSGQHTNSHIIDINGYTFQVPVTWYTQEKKWDMAPGFENKNLRFSRILESECMTCHNHLPRLVEGSLHKFSDMPTGIECERCHGPGEIHVLEKLAGEIVDTSKFIDYSIVNPRDLSRDLQMDLCQRCHLQGLAVLNKDKTFYDFKPGQALSTVMNVYLPRYSESHEEFIMASQADRLKMSPCYIKSEKMTCLTCHHPHHSVEFTPEEQYTDACKSCHQIDVNYCSVSSSIRATKKDNCISCHMPKSGSIDIPHVNITDHNIGKITANNVEKIDQKEKEEIKRFLGLEILTKEKASNLEMAKAYVMLYDKYITSKAILDSTLYYLQSSDTSNLEFFHVKIHYLFNKENYRELLDFSETKPVSEIKNSWTLYRIGEAALKLDELRTAMPALQKACSLMPFDLDYQEKFGIANLKLGRYSEATETFEFILKENPKRPVALNNFGYLNLLKGNKKRAGELYMAAINLDPDYENAFLNLAALNLMNNNLKDARENIEMVLKLDPENEQALKIRNEQLK